MVQTQFNTSIKKIHSDNWGRGDICLVLFKNIFIHMVLFIKPLVLIPLNKTGLLKEKIDIS